MKNLGKAILLCMGDYMVFTIAIAICFQFISEVITNLSINILHINNISYVESQKAYSNIQTSWFGYASILIFAPILEEILTRGIILRQCLRYVSPKWAIIIQAILFGLGHGNTIQFLYTFVGGLFLGYIAYSTKSIIPCIIMHFVVNLTDVLFNSFVQSIVALYLPIIALISIVVVGYIIYTIKISSKSTLSSYSK